MRYIGNGRMVDNNKNLPAWVKAIQDAWDKCTDEWVMTGLYRVRITYYLKSPQKMAGASYDGDHFCRKKPDLDKLNRAVFDALKGRAWVDDAEVVWAEERKVYHEPLSYDKEKGMILCVYPLERTYKHQ